MRSRVSSGANSLKASPKKAHSIRPRVVLELHEGLVVAALAHCRSPGRRAPPCASPRRSLLLRSQQPVEIAEVDADQRRQFVPLRVQRMAAEVMAQRLALALQLLLQRPVRRHRQVDADFRQRRRRRRTATPGRPRVRAPAARWPSSLPAAAASARRGCAPSASSAPALHQRLEHAPVELATNRRAGRNPAGRGTRRRAARASAIASQAPRPTPLTAPRP